MAEIAPSSECVSILLLGIKNLQNSLTSEKADRAKKDAESSAEKASLENTLKEYTDALQVAETAAEANNNDLTMTKEKLKKAVEQIDNLKLMRQKLVQAGIGLANQNIILQQNLAQAATWLESEKERAASLSSENEILKSKLSYVLKVVRGEDEGSSSKEQVVKSDRTSDLQQKEQAKDQVERRLEAFNRGGGNIKTAPMKKSRPPLKTLSRQNVVMATSSNVAAPTTPLEMPPKKARFSSSRDSPRPRVHPKTPKGKSFAVANAFGFDDDD